MDKKEQKRSLSESLGNLNSSQSILNDEISKLEDIKKRLQAVDTTINLVYSGDEPLYNLMGDKYDEEHNDEEEAVKGFEHFLSSKRDNKVVLLNSRISSLKSQLDEVTIEISKVLARIATL